MLGGCYSQGRLVGAEANTQFAAGDPTRILVRSRDTEAYEIRTLSGRYVETLLQGPYQLADIDDAGSHMLLRRGQDRVLAAVASGSVRNVDLGDGWHNVAIDGAGQRIVETSWQQERIRILSFDTLELLQAIECPEEQCTAATWDRADPDVLWVHGYSHNGYERLDLVTGEWLRIPDRAPPAVRLTAELALDQSNRCASTGAVLEVHGNGIDLEEAGGVSRQIVRIAGRHNFNPLAEHFAAIRRAAFVGDCRYAIFDFAGAEWLVDVRSGTLGKLVTGTVLLVMPGNASRDAAAAD